jgi:hypothetical protein
MAKLYVWDFSIGHEGYQNGVNGWHSGPNSAGGVSVKWSFKNNTDKTIKYASFWFTPYNAVNDVVQCSIKRKSTDGVKYTGPLGPGAFYQGCLWENAWYNSSISTCRLSHVYVEYMDGTEERIDVSDISFTRPEGVPAGGCYVATVVYGSYDCPQVWTLRRYRDNVLAETWYGRAFIKTYYAISPTLVKWFGKTEWFKNLWRGKLDSMVEKLQKEGMEDTPYEDRNW